MNGEHLVFPLLAVNFEVIIVVTGVIVVGESIDSSGHRTTTFTNFGRLRPGMGDKLSRAFWTLDREVVRVLHDIYEVMSLFAPIFFRVLFVLIDLCFNCRKSRIE